MEARKHAVGVVAGVLLTCLVIVGGCAQPAGRLSSPRLPAFSEPDALVLARLEAKSQGVPIDAYQIIPRARGRDWLVRFEKPAPEDVEWSRREKWPYRFDVLVASSGEVRLVKR